MGKESGPEDFRLVKNFVQGVDKMGGEILDFEESVKDSGGVYLEFMRVPKVVEEDPKKKPVKGKAQEEVKPCGGKAWIDLSGLQTPGR